MDPSSSSLLSPFSVTLDSLQILPHWEVLEARIEALERRVLGESAEERERRERVDEGRRLVADQVGI